MVPTALAATCGLMMLLAMPGPHTKLRAKARRVHAASDWLMILTPLLRKLVLTAHVTFSVGWLGAVVAYFALSITAGLTTEDAQTVRAAWVAMELIGWYVIVPLALASLLTGLVNALGTPWGLFRHYWVLAKFLLTVFATIILLLHMPDVSFVADVVTTTGGREGGDNLHAGGGLLVLLVLVTLAVYKPQGMTRYGWRKHHQE